MIIAWDRLRRAVAGGPFQGSPVSYSYPLYFFGLGAMEGVSVDTVAIYGAPYADAAREIVNFGWSIARHPFMLFWYPLYLRDGMHVLANPAIHAPTPLFLPA